MSRQVADALGALRERHRLVRGLVSWVGFTQTTLEFERPGRAAGGTKYSFAKMLRLSLDAMTSFSAVPLRLATFLGFVGLVCGAAYAAYAFYIGFVRGLGVPGWTSLVILNIFFSGVVLVCLGLIGEYVGRIFEEVKHRPLYVVRRTARGAPRARRRPPDRGRRDRARPGSDRQGLLTAAVAGAAALLVVLAYAPARPRPPRVPLGLEPRRGPVPRLRRAARSRTPAASTRGRRFPFPRPTVPCVPALMAPLVRLPDPLWAARLVALAWTALGRSPRSRSSCAGRAAPTWAAAGVALYLAPFDLTFWHALVRVDGPMIALWLSAAVPLLPRSLGNGDASCLRAAGRAGTALLLAAVLFKPTAALHGAPLVLGWFLVDRRSAWRLVAAMGIAGLAALLGLQVATAGGFLWVNRLWALHPTVPGLAVTTWRSTWGSRRRPHPRPGRPARRVGNERPTLATSLSCSCSSGALRSCPSWASRGPGGTTCFRSTRRPS